MCVLVCKCCRETVFVTQRLSSKDVTHFQIAANMSSYIDSLCGRQWAADRYAQLSCEPFFGIQWRILYNIIFSGTQ